MKFLKFMMLLKLIILTLLFSASVTAAQWKLSHEVEVGKFKKLCIYKPINGGDPEMKVEQKKGVRCRLYI